RRKPTPGAMTRPVPGAMLQTLFRQQTCGIILQHMANMGNCLQNTNVFKGLSAAQYRGMLEAIMSVQVKICGITTLEDGIAAADAGADALGFVFCETSPRFISIPSAARLISKLPGFIVKVGVFVNAPEELVLQAIAECGLSLLQFHGDEP